MIPKEEIFDIKNLPIFPYEISFGYWVLIGILFFISLIATYFISKKTKKRVKKTLFTKKWRVSLKKQEFSINTDTRGSLNRVSYYVRKSLALTSLPTLETATLKELQLLLNTSNLTPILELLCDIEKMRFERVVNNIEAEEKISKLETIFFESIKLNKNSPLDYKGGDK